MKIIKLTKAGVGRVLESVEGMTFIVDSETVRTNGSGSVVHVRDYRYSINPLDRPFQIWSIGPEGYEIVSDEPDYGNAIHRLRDAVNELDAARDFFQQYVPLEDHNGDSLAHDWSWGPAENAVREGKKVLASLPKINPVTQGA